MKAWGEEEKESNFYLFYLKRRVLPVPDIRVKGGTIH